METRIYLALLVLALMMNAQFMMTKIDFTGNPTRDDKWHKYLYVWDCGIRTLISLVLFNFIGDLAGDTVWTNIRHIGTINSVLFIARCIRNHSW